MGSSLTVRAFSEEGSGRLITGNFSRIDCGYSEITTIGDVEVFNTCAVALVYELRGFEEIVCKTQWSLIAIKLLV